MPSYLLTYSAIASGDKTCVTFFLAWHLAFLWHWIWCGLAWASYASTMNAAPCSFCVGHLLHVHSSLLHCPLPTLFVSSICFFYAILEMSSNKIRFSPAWHSIIGLHEVIFLPLPWSQYRVSVLVMLYQLSFTRGVSLARCAGVSHDVLVVTARAY